MTTSRTLAAALAIGAFATPVAQAQPADDAPAARASATTQMHDPPRDMHAPLAKPATASARAQDLRHLRAGAKVPPAVDATLRSYTPGSNEISGAFADRRPSRVAGPPAWPVNSQPISPAHAVKASDNNGLSPMAIGFGIAASLLALAALVGIARRSRRLKHARVTV